MRRILPFAFLLITALPAQSQAVTAREILELSRAGLGEEVLLALIEVDGGVFTLDTEMLKSLKEARVSERVILAMVRSGRNRPVDAVPPPVMTDPPVDPRPAIAPEPQVIVIEHERPVVEHVGIPVYVAVPQGRVVPRNRRVHQLQHPFDPSPGFGAPLPVSPAPAAVNPEPVYWGWGGRLRPDAWKPPNHIEKPAPKPPGDKK
jgi:hypothetical protein